MKTYICKYCGEFEATEPKCGKYMTMCPHCKEQSWQNGETDCPACFGAGAAMPNTSIEAEMLSLANLYKDVPYAK